jgi:hypothetical protein
VALFTAEAPTSEVQNIARLQFRFASLTVVLFERGAYDLTAPQTRRRKTAVTGSVIRVDGTHSFPAAWNQAYSGRSVMAGRGFG